MTVPIPPPPEQRPEAWGSLAKTYDLFAESVTRQFAEDAARLVHLAPGSQVIDVAAGTGAFTVAAARRGAEVLATDFSAGMLETLERKCANHGLTRVKTAVMDGQELTVADSSFDVAASLFGLIFFPDHDRGLRELLRVLKPGGQAVVTAWAPPPRGEMQQVIGRAVDKAIPGLPEPDEPPHTAALGNVDDLRQRLLSTGFARAHVVSVTHLWTFESPEWLLDRFQSIAPPAAAFFETLTPEQRVAFKRAFGEDFRERDSLSGFKRQGYPVGRRRRTMAALDFSRCNLPQGKFLQRAPHGRPGADRQLVYPTVSRNRCHLGQHEHQQRCQAQGDQARDERVPLENEGETGQGCPAPKNP